MIALTVWIALTTCTITGTPGADAILGTPRADVICAGAGNDVIDGGLGNDIIWAGPGADRIGASAGSDRVNGGPGNDTIWAWDGRRDWIDGGAPWPSDRRVAEIVKAARPAGVTVRTSGGLSADTLLR